MDGDISDRSPQVLLHPDQPLVEGEQRLVNFKHIVISLLYEKLHDYIELAGVGQGKTGFAEHILHFRKGQLQCQGKGNCRGL